MTEKFDWDDAYANFPYIPDGAAYPDRWAHQAAAFRAGARATLDIAYGPHARHRFDLFLPSGTAKGLVLFIHGGYWLKFDKSMWSHLAAGPLARGWVVAMPSYRLAPEVTIAEITQDARAALIAAADQVDGPLIIAGHSAGGHLTARMLCPDVALPETVETRIARALPISPVSDLRPLRNTAMNADFKLDEAAAIAESPALCRNPRPIPCPVWVGGDERPVFIDQARWLAKAWSQADLHIAPGLHHFNVIKGLADPASPLTEALLSGL